MSPLFGTSAGAGFSQAQAGAINGLADLIDFHHGLAGAIKPVTKRRNLNLMLDSSEKLRRFPLNPIAQYSDRGIEY